VIVFILDWSEAIPELEKIKVYIHRYTRAKQIIYHVTSTGEDKCRIVDTHDISEYKKMPTALMARRFFSLS